jgi:hypothetical protein
MSFPFLWLKVDLWDRGATHRGRAEVRRHRQMSIKPPPPLGLVPGSDGKVQFKAVAGCSRGFWIGVPLFIFLRKSTEDIAVCVKLLTSLFKNGHLTLLVPAQPNVCEVWPGPPINQLRHCAPGSQRTVYTLSDGTTLGPPRPQGRLTDVSQRHSGPSASNSGLACKTMSNKEL